MGGEADLSATQGSLTVDARWLLGLRTREQAHASSRHRSCLLVCGDVVKPRQICPKFGQLAPFPVPAEPHAHRVGREEAARGKDQPPPKAPKAPKAPNPSANGSEQKGAIPALLQQTKPKKRVPPAQDFILNLLLEAARRQLKQLGGCA